MKIIFDSCHIFRIECSCCHFWSSWPSACVVTTTLASLYPSSTGTFDSMIQYPHIEYNKYLSLWMSTRSIYSFIQLKTTLFIPWKDSYYVHPEKSYTYSLHLIESWSLEIADYYAFYSSLAWPSPLGSFLRILLGWQACKFAEDNLYMVVDTIGKR